MHQSDCLTGRPVVGDRAVFVLPDVGVAKHGKRRATRVAGCSGGVAQVQTKGNQVVAQALPLEEQQQRLLEDRIRETGEQLESTRSIQAQVFSRGRPGTCSHEEWQLVISAGGRVIDELNQRLADLLALRAG